LLTNYLVARDTNGTSVPAGATRISAFRSGLIGDTRLGVTHRDLSPTKMRVPKRTT
jgi:hypothetical protein